MKMYEFHKQFHWILVFIAIIGTNDGWITDIYLRHLASMT